MISQLAQFGARRGRIRHPDRSFWKQKRRYLTSSLLVLDWEPSCARLCRFRSEAEKERRRPLNRCAAALNERKVPFLLRCKVTKKSWNLQFISRKFWKNIASALYLTMYQSVTEHVCENIVCKGISGDFATPFTSREIHHSISVSQISVSFLHVIRGWRVGKCLNNVSIYIYY